MLKFPMTIGIVPRTIGEHRTVTSLRQRTEMLKLISAASEGVLLLLRLPIKRFNVAGRFRHWSNSNPSAIRGEAVAVLRYT